MMSCAQSQKYDEQFPKVDESEWITYEGRIPLSETSALYQVVAMRPSSSAGDGDYELTEFVEEEGSQRQVASFRGRYSTYITDVSVDEPEVHLHNSAQLTGVTRVYPSENGKRIRQEQFRKKDLILKRVDENTLIVLSYSHEPVSEDPKFQLSKRVSEVFTIEGKFAHIGDSSVFYEINTEKVWPVAKLGAYDQATRQYHQLANEKNEGIYLKGTGFTVNWPARNHATMRALVFKKIITMSSNPQ